MAPVRYHLGGFPPPQLDWQQLIPLLGPANASLARYDGLLEGIPNPAVLLSPLSSQEAVLSSRIEGTQATIAEDLEIEDARFVPISADKLDAAMGSWESFIHAEFPDRLVQLAIVHAEFESLHPFLDGNGRIGRMVLPLFLWQAGILRMPYFYLSAYFEANKDSYVERLLAISRDGDWTGWCRYFLEAVQARRPPTRSTQWQPWTGSSPPPPSGPPISRSTPASPYPLPSASSAAWRMPRSLP